MERPANGVVVPTTGPTERAGFDADVHERIEQLVGYAYQAVPLDGIGVAYIAPPGVGAPNPRATEIIARHGTRLHPPIIVTGQAAITGRTLLTGEPSPIPARVLVEIDELPDAGDPQLAELRCHALRYGWALTTSVDDTGAPVVSTVGLTAHGHAEIVSFGAAADTRRALNALAAALAAAQPHGLPAGVQVDDADPRIYSQSWWQPIRRYHQLWTPDRVDVAVVLTDPGSAAALTA